VTWLVERDVEEVVMESTARYWRPVWDALERHWQPARRTPADAGPTSGALHLAQAQSNEGRRGRKKDFPTTERLVKRLVAHEPTLSFVPGRDAAPVADGQAPQVPNDVRREASTVRVSLRLIDALADRQVWSQSYPLERRNDSIERACR
jgi:hypothetical protein